MFRILTILLVFALAGCNNDFESNTVKGNWTSICYYTDGNVLSGVEGEYSFSNDTFTAKMRNCVDSSELTVSFPYSVKKYVMLNDYMEARELNIEINDDDVIPALVYLDPDTDQLYWSWGLDNTSIDHSIFGFFMVDDVPTWGGYPLSVDGDNFLPITSDFPDLERPTTVNFEHFLEMD